jgi:CRISPR-associated endonuclease/helicase Cas3
LPFPRRLVYVVNRRTVVDQATREAEKLRARLAECDLVPLAAALRSLAVSGEDVPLAISTLRGAFADNAEWRLDPARPAVIVGTVDMIGSRLLFSGYGCGFKSRPLHAGFLGQDALLVHDEAHLEPPFQALVESIAEEQSRREDLRPLRVLELTATPRTDGGAEEPLFTERDRAHTAVQRRYEARKSLTLVPVGERADVADEITKCAEVRAHSGRAILVFVQRVDDAMKVALRLRKRRCSVQMLTGTLRGLERDQLATRNEIFARFARDSHVAPKEGTVFLVCTSAGEVGVDISADDLICDLTPFDSMAQRFGRVNRFGDGKAEIEVVYVTAEPEREYERCCARTLALLNRLPLRDGRLDASPAALAGLSLSERLEAFTPPPLIRRATEILFDAWSLTTIGKPLPGRPPVDEWLHGIDPDELPETYVAWREEVERIAGDLLFRYRPEDLLDDFPLKPHELLRDATSRVYTEVKKLAKRVPDKPVWLVTRDGSVTHLRLNELADGDLAHATLLLPPSAGGLSEGLLDGAAEFDRSVRYDVADEVSGGGSRIRLRAFGEAPPAEAAGMRVVRTIDLACKEYDDEEEVAQKRYWRWYVRPRAADDDGSQSARVEQLLDEHLCLAERFAQRLVASLALPQDLAHAVTMAARYHDLGKRRGVWQRSIGNFGPDIYLAKSGGEMNASVLTNYRHELGSVLDVCALRELAGLGPDMRDLVLHLIAAHHGRARPHFPKDEAFDPERPAADAQRVAEEVPRRFARLQRRYGRWGLAYLESLVRAADALASQAVVPAAAPAFVASQAEEVTS